MGFWPLLLLLGPVTTSFLDYIAVKNEMPAGLAGRDRIRVEQLFPNTNITAVQQKIAMRKVSLTAQLELNNKTKNEMGKRLKKYKQKPKTKVREQGDSIHEINKKTNISNLLYQGDIVLTVSQANKLEELSNSRGKRQAYVDQYYPTTTWGRTIYYYFDSSVPAAHTVRSVFAKAVKFWQSNTCLTFKENSSATNRIRVFRGQGCYSYIGRIGGQQDLSLGDGCESIGTAAHELGHAMGFFHLQSRYDRDNYITVNVQNIEYSYIDQFDKETTSTNNNYGMPYDYGSIMQYGGLSASSNGKPTMVAKDIKYQDTMGSDIVGFYDVSMMNEYYKCKNICKAATSVKCQNGGFPNPSNCSVCICPSGYGGTLCTEKPSGCGTTLKATTTPQTLKDVVGMGSTKPLEDFTYCYYWIEAPVGQKIQITLKNYSGYYTDGCPYGGVEIKTQSDQKLTGYRYCSNADAGTPLTSTSNIVPIITYNRILKSAVVLEYKLVGTTSATTVAPKSLDVNTSSICKENSANCFVLQYFGYCTLPQVQKRCPRSCGKCT